MVDFLNSGADKCLNCSFSVKSTKFGTEDSFQDDKKDRLWRQTLNCSFAQLRGILKMAAILNRKWN